MNYSHNRFDEEDASLYFNQDEIAKMKDGKSLARVSSPHHVSSEKNPENETFEQIAVTQEKFLRLPDHIQDKLVSDDTSAKIAELGTRYSLSPTQIGDISRTIRGYYFGEIKLGDFVSILYKETAIDIDTVKKIAHEIVEEIINDNSEKTTSSSRTIQTTISEALRTYPQIGEQTITSEKLELKSFPYPVRPSINNWISDYTFTVGFNNTNPMIRGNYLFRNKNTERLTEEERNRLSQILKSLDENTPVSIDEANKTVMFLKMETPAQKKQSPVLAPKTAAANDDDHILNERLSAWRTEPREKQNQGEWNIGQKSSPQQAKNDSQESRVIFSSPQRLPIEKDIPRVANKSVFQKPSPVSDPTPAAPIRTYSNEPVDLSNIRMKSQNENIPPARNVVNLKEE